MDKQESHFSKEAAWRSRLLRHAQSGKSIAAFCRDESVSTASFHIWREKLAAASGHTTKPAQPATFIDLGAITNTASVTSKADSHASAPARKTRIAAHEREPRNKNRNLIDGNDDAALFFDDAKVPVEVIAVANEESAGLDPADFEVIGERVSYRLAQRPGSYVILKYVRPVIKLRAGQTLSCPPAPVGVLDGSRRWPDGASQARTPPRTIETCARTVLRLGRRAVRQAGIPAEQSLPRCPAVYPRARLAGYSDG